MLSKNLVRVIHKESTYRSLQGSMDLPEGTLIDNFLSFTSESDFNVGQDPQLNVLLRTENQGSPFYTIVPITLGLINVKCWPMTNLLAFLKSEEQRVVNFTIMGATLSDLHISEIRFKMNVVFIFFFGKIGTFFWISMWFTGTGAVLAALFRTCRLSIKRVGTIKKFEKVIKDEREVVQLLKNSS